MIITVTQDEVDRTIALAGYTSISESVADEVLKKHGYDPDEVEYTIDG